MVVVDSHCHIDGREYDEDREEVIQRAIDSGVVAMLNVGTGDPHSGDFERAIELSRQHEQIYSAVGVHPHDARLFDEAAADKIKSLITDNPKCIAWGEIGLDYHYDHSPRETQRAVFRRQLRLARDLGVTVIIHTREAEEDTLQILREEWSQPNSRGIMHCFSGSLELAQSCMDLGFRISFAGNVTFKKADELRAVAAQIPLDRLLAETDCPYLSPAPFRGRRNEPARVIETVRFIAGIRGITLDDLGSASTENFLRLFNLP